MLELHHVEMMLSKIQQSCFRLAYFNEEPSFMALHGGSDLFNLVLLRAEIHALSIYQSVISNAFFYLEDESEHSTLKVAALNDPLWNIENSDFTFRPNKKINNKIIYLLLLNSLRELLISDSDSEYFYRYETRLPDACWMIENAAIFLPNSKVYNLIAIDYVHGFSVAENLSKLIASR